MADAGYPVNFDECEVSFSDVEFLGVMVGREETQPAPSKVEAFQKTKMPTAVGDVRVFLRIAGFLRDFAPKPSTLVVPT